jgi:hypothetical protein
VTCFFVIASERIFHTRRISPIIYLKSRVDTLLLTISTTTAWKIIKRYSKARSETMAATSPPPRKPPKLGVKESYLISYNALCCLGWSYVLIVGIPSLFRSFSSSLYSGMSMTDALRIAGGSVYSSTPRTAGYTDEEGDLSLAFVLTIVQSMAVGEVVHAIAGLVRSPVFVTLLQVGSRIVALNMINSSPKAQGESPFVSLVAFLLLYLIL